MNQGEDVAVVRGDDLPVRAAPRWFTVSRAHEERAEPSQQDRVLSSGGAPQQILIPGHLFSTEGHAALRPLVCCRTVADLAFTAWGPPRLGPCAVSVTRAPGQAWLASCCRWPAPR